MIRRLPGNQQLQSQHHNHKPVVGKLLAEKLAKQIRHQKPTNPQN